MDNHDAAQAAHDPTGEHAEQAQRIAAARRSFQPVVAATHDPGRGSLAVSFAGGQFVTLAVDDPQTAAQIEAMVGLEESRGRASAHGHTLTLHVVSSSWHYAITGIPALR